MVAKGGPRITASVAPAQANGTAAGGSAPPGTKAQMSGFKSTRPGEIQAIKASLESFASGLLSKMPETEGRVVVNKTGLTGNYDFTLTWAPERVALEAVDPVGAPTSSTEDDTRPGLFTALEEELGLKLESQKGSVEGLVVEHVERPTAN